MVRGRVELGPDHGMDANDDGSSGDDESASFQLDRWVPGLSGLGGLVWSSGPVGPCRRRSPLGGPGRLLYYLSGLLSMHTALGCPGDRGIDSQGSYFCHGPQLTLVPTRSDDLDAATSVHPASGLR